MSVPAKVMLPISPATRAKLEAVCQVYGFTTADAFAEHILVKRLAQLPAEHAEDLLEEVSS